jgi:hypothetical protein
MEGVVDYASRFETLEEEFAELKAQNATMLSQQNDIIELLKLKLPDYLTPTRKNDSKLRPATPNDFDGDRSKGRDFIHSCDLYVKLVPHQFDNSDHKAIHWAISYMKSGRAALFARRVLRDEAKSKIPKYPTWEAFREAFVAEFCPKNETQLALAKLETTRYHQGKRTVDEYVDDFRELIDQAGYMEGLGIVTKFRRGLNKEIQDQIANIPIGRPDDANPDEWYEAAIRSDENRIANELFHSAPRTTMSAKPSSSFPPVAPRPATNTSWFSRPSTVAHKPPPVSNPVPMEIDAAKKRADIPDTCRRCGQTGHWARDCAKRFDIRFLFADEKEALLQDWAIDADTKELEEKIEEPEAETPTGFQSRSG